MSYRLALQPVPETPDLRMNLADLLMLRGSFEEAQTLYASVRAVDPQHREAEIGEIHCLISLGEWVTARAALEASLRTTQSGRMLHLLARVLAVAPTPTADPQQALDLANQVFNARRTPDHAATLGLALAAAGQFKQAERWHEELLADTKPLGKSWGFWLRSQLEAFRAQKAWYPKESADFFSPEQG